MTPEDMERIRRDKRLTQRAAAILMSTMQPRNDEERIAVELLKKERALPSVQAIQEWAKTHSITVPEAAWDDLSVKLYDVICNPYKKSAKSSDSTPSH